MASTRPSGPRRPDTPWIYCSHGLYRKRAAGSRAALLRLTRRSAIGGALHIPALNQMALSIELRVKGRRIDPARYEGRKRKRNRLAVRRRAKCAGHVLDAVSLMGLASANLRRIGRPQAPTRRYLLSSALPTSGPCKEPIIYTAVTSL